MGKGYRQQLPDRDPQETEEWIESIEEILFDDEEYGEYQQKGYERVQQLKDREQAEITAFIEFLEKLV